MLLYDLSAVADYLSEAKFDDGDVLDAFRHAYNNYDRPGYWNEKKVRDTRSFAFIELLLLCAYTAVLQRHRLSF